MPKVRALVCQKGFTLIELLVSIFIIGLISGAVLTGYRTGQMRYNISRAAQQMAVDLHRVQNMALVGKTQGATVPAGYGFYTSSASQYILFYNTTSVKTYGSGSTVLETISLENASLSPTGRSVYFTPPEPLTYINGANSGSQNFVLTSGGTNKTVTVYASGRIDIE